LIHLGDSIEQVTEAINTKELNGMCTKAWRSNRRELNVYGSEAEVFAYTILGWIGLQPKKFLLNPLLANVENMVSS